VDKCLFFQFWIDISDAPTIAKPSSTVGVEASVFANTHTHKRVLFI